MPVSLEIWFSRAHFLRGQRPEDALKRLGDAPGSANVLNALHRGVGQVFRLQGIALVLDNLADGEFQGLQFRGQPCLFCNHGNSSLLDPF